MTGCGCGWGRRARTELDRIIAEGGRKGQIYRDLKILRDRYADLIRKKYPKIPRRVSGYNLDELLPENGFNVARALVGSEGTCVTILEATLNLIDHPPAQSLLVLGYPDVYSAGDHIPQIMQFGPIGLEGIDDKLIDYMKKKKLHPQDIQLLPDGGGWLLVEFGGQDKEEADEKARRTMRALKKEKNPPSMKLFTDEKETSKVWEIRESGLGATAFVPDLPLCWPGWEDAAVPPDKVGDYLRDFRKLLEKNKYVAALYGHFGQGCIHCRISFDLFTHDGIQQYVRFVEEASDLVESYGGSFSGEHGDGQSRAQFLPKMYGEELMQAFREFKRIWDPDWMMNPGKVIDPYRVDEHLRLGTDYNPWDAKTHFQFPEDEGSFHRAALRCVGVGKCRRTHDAFMCPSFLATREEKDTTRGRAHLLFEMFRGDFLQDGWKSKEVHDSLDLCLACKGCKTDCPVNVDMATYKAEFLSHFYEGKVRPRDAYAMGLIGWWGELASKMPALANTFSSAPLSAAILKAAAGVHQERTLPKFAAEPFDAWFRRRRPAVPAEAARGEVVLYPDAFNNYFYPNTLKAALQVLERFGYRVRLPAGKVPEIRPAIHYGMLDLAEHTLLKAVGQLHPFVVRGVPVIILEPSTAAVFRDELPQLFPEDHDGQRVTQLTSCSANSSNARSWRCRSSRGRRSSTATATRRRSSTSRRRARCCSRWGCSSTNRSRGAAAWPAPSASRRSITPSRSRSARRTCCRRCVRRARKRTSSPTASAAARRSWKGATAIRCTWRSCCCSPSTRGRKGRRTATRSAATSSRTPRFSPPPTLVTGTALLGGLAAVALMRGRK